MKDRRKNRGVYKVYSKMNNTQGMPQSRIKKGINRKYVVTIGRVVAYCEYCGKELPIGKTRLTRNTRGTKHACTECPKKDFSRNVKIVLRDRQTIVYEHLAEGAGDVYPWYKEKYPGTRQGR